MNFLQNSQTSWKFLLIIIILAVIAVGVIYFSYNEYIKAICLDKHFSCAQNMSIECRVFGRCINIGPTACTQEAKQCPDGSYVGRTSPNCEFAACPETKDETAGWQTYRNNEYGFEVKYPNNLEVRDLTLENKQYVKNIILLIGLCDIQITSSCNGTTIQVYSGEYREPSIAEGIEVKRFSKNNLTFWLGGDNQILSTFKFIQPKATIEYRNNDYGFTFSLPESWKGYSVVKENWNDSKEEQPVSGPKILIRNPKWTVENPYQDIPIMVFTISQWNAVLNGDIVVSAAPIPPTELGRNAKYVFALPARYNYAFPTGYEEVEKILENHPLKAF